jgi:hypothetical protein
VSTHFWTPGAAGPLDEFVARLMRMVASFTEENALSEAEVRLELADGSRYLLAAAAPEPGFGFFCFTPHADEDGGARRVVVPIGAVKLIEISAPDAERPFGFSVDE